jgi:hypothetical protein
MKYNRSEKGSKNQTELYRKNDMLESEKIMKLPGCPHER